MDFQVNTFKNCRSPRVESTVDYSSVLKEIETGKSFGYVITQARDFGKGTPEFEEIKVGKVPTYTVNATFEQKRNKDFISATTGFLYLDVDGETEVDISNPYIYSTYKSFSGTGRGIVVKVSGLTLENLKWTYQYAGDLVGVSPDPSCADITRQVVLSYDPYLKVNTESKVIDVNGFYPGGTKLLELYSEYLPNKERALKRYIKSLPEKKEKRSNDLLYSFVGEKLRWNNLDEYEIEGDYIIFEEKEPVVVVYIPLIIHKGGRYRTISLLINNLCFLNPFLDAPRIYGLLKKINQRCEEPLSKNEMLKIHSDVVRRIEEGSLQPVYTKERKIMFHQDCPDSIKRKMMGVASGMVRSENTLNKIQIALDDWDLNFGRITNGKLADVTELHVNTIKKYLRSNRELKDQKRWINERLRKI